MKHKIVVKIMSRNSIAQWTFVLVRDGETKEELRLSPRFIVEKYGDTIGYKLDNGKRIHQIIKEVETLTEKGWTKIDCIISYNYEGPMICIWTPESYIRITDNYSLLGYDGNKIDMKDVKIGDKLLNYENSIDIEITEIKRKKYSGLVYYFETNNNHFQAGNGSLVLHNINSTLY